MTTDSQWTYDLVDTSTGAALSRQPMTRRAVGQANEALRKAEDPRRWVLAIPELRDAAVGAAEQAAIKWEAAKEVEVNAWIEWEKASAAAQEFEPAGE